MSQISDFYAKKGVLITGTTGFLGKVLLEKLLRSCPAIKVIYVLLRPHKGVDASERIKRLLQEKGWIDNFNGASGILVANSKGLLRSMHCNLNCVADFIPVDVVINLLIAVGWYTGTNSPKDVIVYHCTSGSTNKLTWGDLDKMKEPLVSKYPSRKMIFYPTQKLLTTNKLYNCFSIWILHYMIYYLIDLGYFLVRRKPRLVAIFKTIQLTIHYIAYVLFNELIFETNNMFSLMEALSAQDKQEFNFDIRSLEWPSYMEVYYSGMRQYLLKEDPSTIPFSRQKLKKIYLQTKLIQGAVICFMLLIFVSLLVGLCLIGAFAAKSIIY